MKKKRGAINCNLEIPKHAEYWAAIAQNSVDQLFYYSRHKYRPQKAALQRPFQIFVYKSS